MNETTFGNYRLRKLLGEGGMGRVYEAYDTITDRTVALKVLSSRVAADPLFRERFRRESHAAAGLTEPHVIPIHHYGEIDGRLYLDMRLVDGVTVERLLADSGPTTPGLAVAIIEQVASALNAAHANNLIHRDVIPSNMLVCADNFVYLIDFGLARAGTDSGLTTSGSAIGTFTYMSPERLTEGVVDARADVYALTCVLHECLTGSQPYPGTSVEQQITAHLVTPPPRPSRIRPGVPGGFDEVIARGMAKKPEHRFSSAGQLAAAARAVLTQPDSTPQPIVYPPRAHSPAPVDRRPLPLPAPRFPVGSQDRSPILPGSHELRTAPTKSGARIAIAVGVVALAATIAAVAVVAVRLRNDEPSAAGVPKSIASSAQSTTTSVHRTTPSAVYSGPASTVTTLPPTSEGTLHSIEGTQSTSIEFVNSRSGPVIVYWLDYSGKRVRYQTLAAGGSYVQQTYVTHPWVVCTTADVAITLFMPGTEPSRAIISG
ncbi:protein kinase [Nocardia sp. NPDC052001]|uniref:protein kinase domain-containing protein n=1 Tax=Nocardia sp. NPDC052001 TaxID=3154853 RepID=UPI0034371C9A